MRPLARPRAPGRSTPSTPDGAHQASARLTRASASTSSKSGRGHHRSSWLIFRSPRVDSAKGAAGLPRVLGGAVGEAATRRPVLPDLS